MKKEELKLENIKKDLQFVANICLSNAEEWRKINASSFIVIGIIVGFAFSSILWGIIVSAFSLYDIYHYIIAHREYKAQKKALSEMLDRGDISISLEKLSHISEETIYEPHWGSRNVHDTKQVSFYYFSAGRSWRVPSTGCHYKWSKDYYFTTQGLLNISVSGNEFFYVSLQGHFEISYIYPCKFFTLSEELKTKTVEKEASENI